MSFVISVLSAVVGTLGFCLFFRLRFNRLPVIAVLSAICYSTYLVMGNLGFSDFASITFASILTASFSEFFAVTFRAPVTVFLIPSILPLIPGSHLYYAIEAIFKNDISAGLSHTSAMCRAIGGLVFGIIIVSTTMHCIRDRKNKT
jgi:uncharacterized membrane protein YjjB (DUF3815 family)